MLYFMIGGTLFYYELWFLFNFCYFQWWFCFFFFSFVDFLFFSLYHFTPATGKIETLQDTLIISRYHENNQNYIYEFCVVYLEETKSGLAESGQTLSGLLFLEYS